MTSFAMAALTSFSPRSFTPLLQADPGRPLYDENMKNDMQDCRVAALQQIQQTKAGSRSSRSSRSRSRRSRSSRSSRVINGGEGAELGVQLAARWCKKGRAPNPRACPAAQLPKKS